MACLYCLIFLKSLLSAKFKILSLNIKKKEKRKKKAPGKGNKDSKALRKQYGYCYLLLANNWEPNITEQDRHEKCGGSMKNTSVAKGATKEGVVWLLTITIKTKYPHCNVTRDAVLAFRNPPPHPLHPHRTDKRT